MPVCAQNVFSSSVKDRVRPEKISRAISGYGARSCAPVPPNCRERDFEASRDPRGRMAKGGRLKEESESALRDIAIQPLAFRLQPFPRRTLSATMARVRRFAASAWPSTNTPQADNNPCYPSRQPAPLTFQAIAAHESTDTCREKLADSPTPWSQPVQTGFTARRIAAEPRLNPATARSAARPRDFREERPNAGNLTDCRRGGATSPRRTRGRNKTAPRRFARSLHRARTSGVPGLIFLFTRHGKELRTVT